jgi:lipopolysaccharide biosynthesis glycosyltransferase
MDFVTKTYDSEAHVTYCAAKKISDLYPNSKFYIYEGGYDGGLNNENREKISNIKNTKVINWKEPYEFNEEVEFFETHISRLESIIKETTYLNYIINSLVGYEYDRLEQYNMKRYDYLYRRKPLVILDIANSIDGNIAWIDADVVVLRNIDELFQYDYDIGATVRNKYTEIKRDGYRDLDPASLSTGVLIFKTNSENICGFVNSWLTEISSLTLTKIREQTAVKNLFEHSNEDIFESYYNEGHLKTESGNLKTKIFPADIYNHFKLESGVNPNKHKVLHFPQKESSLQINKDLISDICDGNIRKWYRE